MKLNNDYIKLLIKTMGFIPKDGEKEIFYKVYTEHNNYIIKVDFDTAKIDYGTKIRLGDHTTSNFENSENFVVLECVNRLLEKGYSPEKIYLEYKWLIGRKEKGKLDILVFDNFDKAYLMIECKTWGAEFEKEKRKMLLNGGQLLSYYVQNKAARYLCLYTSKIDGLDHIQYINQIINVDSQWKELNDQKEIFDYWNKNFKDNGIFEEWSMPYNVKIKALTRGKLKELTSEDSGKIFNQFAEILRHNVVSDKPNAFNKILNLFICKIIDENKSDTEETDFQWKENDTNESLQSRLNELYKKGMSRFLDIDVTDYTDKDISEKLININEEDTKIQIQQMFEKLRLQKNPEFAFKEVYNEESFKDNGIVVKEVVELLQPYQFRYGHKQQFLGDFFERLLNTSIKQEAGQYFTPVPIAKFIVTSLPIKEMIDKKIENDEQEILPTVIDYAAGSGHFLTEYMDIVQKIINNYSTDNIRRDAQAKINNWKQGNFEWANDTVYGIEADYRLVKTTKVSSFLNGDGEAVIIRANGLDNFSKSKDYRGKLRKTLSNNQDNGQFDIVIANPPYSVSAFKNTIEYGDESFTLYDKISEGSSEIECFFVERTKQLLKVDGIAGIILPISIFTNNSNVYVATREIILKNFYIKAIVEFGSNTFMATNTNTVTLFLKKRNEIEYKIIENAINLFFETYRDATVNKIENAFSKYVSEIYDDIDLNDYKTLLLGKPNEKMREEELYKEYLTFFENMKKKGIIDEDELIKSIKEKEKERILYFILTYSDRLVLVKTGDKQKEKDFIGYEFSNRRGTEGINVFRDASGNLKTKLFDDDKLNHKKANSYIYELFLDNEIEIDNELKDNISYCNLIDIIDFSKPNFDKNILLNLKKKSEIKSKYNKEKISNLFNKGLLECRGGNTFKKIYQGNINKNDVPFYKVSDMNTEENNKYMYSSNNYVNKEVLNNDLSIKKLFKNGTVIFPKAGMTIHTNKKRILSLDAMVDNNIMGLFSNDEEIIMNKYIYEIFNRYINLSDIASNSNPPSISAEDLGRIKIPIPPVDVQKKIINEIEQIDSQISRKKEEINELQKSLIKKQYFDYKEDKIKNLKVMMRRGKSAKYGNSKIQVIKSGQARGFEKFDFTNKYFATEKYESDERNLQKGDILINSTGVGTAGRVTLFNLDGDYIVDSHITILRLDTNKVLPKYVLYCLANIGFSNIEKMATGQSGQIELAPDTIGNIKISVPPISVQEEIIKEIEDKENKIYQIEQTIKKLYNQQSEIIEKYIN